MEKLNPRVIESYTQIKDVLDPLLFKGRILPNFLSTRLLGPLESINFDLNDNQCHKILDNFCQECKQPDELYSDICNCAFHRKSNRFKKICTQISNEIIPKTIFIIINIPNNITAMGDLEVQNPSIRENRVLLQKIPSRNPSRFIIRGVNLDRNSNSEASSNLREIELELEVINYWIDPEYMLEFENLEPNESSTIITSNLSDNTYFKINLDRLQIELLKIQDSINHFSHEYSEHKRCETSLYSILTSLNNHLKHPMEKCEKEGQYHQQKFEMVLTWKLILCVLPPIYWGIGWGCQRLYYGQNHKAMAKDYQKFKGTTLATLRSEIVRTRQNFPKIIEYIFGIEEEILNIHQILIGIRQSREQLQREKLQLKEAQEQLQQLQQTHHEQNQIRNATANLERVQQTYNCYDEQFKSDLQGYYQDFNAITQNIERYMRILNTIPKSK